MFCNPGSPVGQLAWSNASLSAVTGFAELNEARLTKTQEVTVYPKRAFTPNMRGVLEDRAQLFKFGTSHVIKKKFLSTIHLLKYYEHITLLPISSATVFILVCTRSMPI